MAEHDRGELLGYLLGALDADDERALAEQLAGDAGLRRELVRVRASLKPLAPARRSFRPPKGLAARTCEFVALFAGPPPPQDAPKVEPRRRAERMSASYVPPSSVATWSWTDLAAAIAVLFAIGLALVPAIQHARSRARLATCQNNLREFALQYAHAAQQYPRQLPNALRRERPPLFAPDGLGGTALSAASPAQNVLLGDGRVLVVCTGTQYVPGDALFGPPIPRVTRLPRFDTPAADSRDGQP
jgi:hypothetical protein